MIQTQPRRNLLRRPILLQPSHHITTQLPRHRQLPRPAMRRTSHSLSTSLSSQRPILTRHRRMPSNLTTNRGPMHPKLISNPTQRPPGCQPQPDRLTINNTQPTIRTTNTTSTRSRRNHPTTITKPQPRRVIRHTNRLSSHPQMQPSPNPSPNLITNTTKNHNTMRHPTTPPTTRRCTRN